MRGHVKKGTSGERYGNGDMGKRDKGNGGMGKEEQGERRRGKRGTRGRKIWEHGDGRHWK